MTRTQTFEWTASFGSMTPAEAIYEAEELDFTFEDYADMTWDQLNEIWPGEMEPKDDWVREVVRAMEDAADER